MIKLYLDNIFISNYTNCIKINNTVSIVGLLVLGFKVKRSLDIRILE